MKCDSILMVPYAISTISIEAYLQQIQHVLNSTLTKLSKLLKFHGAFESRVLDMHVNSSLKEDKQLKSSFVVKL